MALDHELCSDLLADFYLAGYNTAQSLKVVRRDLCELLMDAVDHSAEVYTKHAGRCVAGGSEPQSGSTSGSRSGPTSEYSTTAASTAASTAAGTGSVASTRGDIDNRACRYAARKDFQRALHRASRDVLEHMAISLDPADILAFTRRKLANREAAALWRALAREAKMSDGLLAYHVSERKLRGLRGYDGDPADEPSPSIDGVAYLQYRLPKKPGRPATRVEKDADGSWLTDSVWHFKKHDDSGWTVFGDAIEDYVFVCHEFFAVRVDNDEVQLVVGFGRGRKHLSATSEAAFAHFLEHHGDALGYYSGWDM